MSEELGKSGCLNNISFDISKDIVSQGLHDLWYVKESDIDRVTLQSPNSILND